MREQSFFEAGPFGFEWEGQTSDRESWDDSVWALPIAMAIEDGERDENRLTDKVFYMRHPELKGRRLQPNEKQLMQEWLDIRDRLVRPPLRAITAVLAKSKGATPKPTGPAVWPSAPLPASEAPRFANALAKLEALVTASNDPRKWRYQCWIQKLKTSDVDDRVIGWHKICPTKGVAPFYILPCDISLGWPIDPDKIYNGIRSVADVDTAGPPLGIVTYLKPHIVVDEEMTSLPLENLRVLHDDVVQAIDKLGKWANVPLGGSSSMPVAYRSIKDWIGKRQGDPRSVYSCK